MSEETDAITRIVPDRRRPDRLLIERNGLPWLRLSALRISELGVRTGEVLTPERRARLEHAAAVEEAIEAALRLLAARPRSEAELARRLRQKGFRDAVVQEVMTKLRALGYVDDRAFVAFWVAQRRTSRPRGIAALRQELRAKGITDELIEAAVTHDAEEEFSAALALAQKHLGRLQQHDRVTQERRVIGLLQRRGFSWSVIRRVVREVFSGKAGDDDFPLAD
jgi:regulatory protein